MTWARSYSYPRAILHVDGDSFFASVEVAKNPALRGKPVITGKERGIVSACTYEAKRRGVMRGVRLSDALKACPDAVVLPSDYETYSLFSERMYEIVRRYTPMVEEYSIDECFADLTGMRRVNRMNYRDMAHAIKQELQVELGLTFSVGLSATKTLAKIGSKWKKPDGFTAIPLNEADRFLKKTPLTGIWGIGANTGAYLNKHGIYTAYDFVKKDEGWVKNNLSKPYHETWRELRGDVCFELATGKKTSYQSISKTKTFTPPSRDEKFVYAQLSKNVENACIKARRWNLVTDRIFFFLKTQDFKYRGFEIRLPYATSIPQDILREIAKFFPQVFQKGELYRASGITLTNLAHGEAQLDLFGKVKESEATAKVFESIDAISEKYGKHAVFLGSSFDAMQSAKTVRSADGSPGLSQSERRRGTHLGARGDLPERTRQLFEGETKRRRLAIPLLGDVR